MRAKGDVMSSGTDDAGSFGPFTTEQYKEYSAENEHPRRRVPPRGNSVESGRPNSTPEALPG
jgi:hypothetical protein